MRVAFVTTADVGAVHDDVDIPLQRAAFADAGHELLEWAWEDEDVAWDAADVVVIRSPWNWTRHVDAFRRWLDRVESIPLHNPAAVVRWNLDKRYLADLAALGVPIVPTTFVSSADDIDAVLASCGTAEVVIKPTVSAGSRLTGRFAADDRAAHDLCLAILDDHNEAMVQPHVASVAVDGEVGTVCFDGVVSHSFRKGPLLALGGGFVTGDYEERIAPHTLAHDERGVVDHVLDALSTICTQRAFTDEPLLYARIDTVRLDDGSVALLELEVFEPCFFLEVDPGSANRFVRAVEERYCSHD